MGTPSLSRRVADRLTSRSGAWAILAAAALLMALLFGLFAGAEAPTRPPEAPAGSESRRVDALLQTFPDADRGSVLIVASRDDDGDLSRADLRRLSALTPDIAAHAAGRLSSAVVSDDGRAAVLTVPVRVGQDETETTATIAALRTALAAHAGDGLVLRVTGGPAFAADIASSFDGADLRLLLVTVLIVAILLVATYRSPLLWLIPLAVVGLADGLAGRVTAAAGTAWGFGFDTGIVSVLVFGAGTNYALLLISRYREELQHSADDRAALSAAWRATLPAIVASNLTVVLALLTLTFAQIPSTRGLGVPAALGLVIAAAAVLFVLPPLLAVCGRGVFWPFIPRPDGRRPRRSLWGAVASGVARRAGTSLATGVVLLAVMATGLAGTSIGLDQLEKFRVRTESAAGLETLAAHFPPGEAQPAWIVTRTAAADQVGAAAAAVRGVVQVQPAGRTADGSLTRLRVISAYAPGTEASLDQVDALRTRVHDVVGAEALVGGQVATERDARTGNAHDLRLIAPLVLAVSFLVLVVLLRALVAPVLLLLVNPASALAAMGAGAWLSRIVLDQPALDPQVPILAFLFLVALGIDYTIFLVHRARAEASRRDTRGAIVESVTHTGAVITSAGIVLAGVFAALAVLPLITLGQLGLIVGVGVLADPVIVRTVITPAIFSLLGDRVWWPRRTAPHKGDSAHGTSPRAVETH